MCSNARGWSTGVSASSLGAALGTPSLLDKRLSGGGDFERICWATRGLQALQAPGTLDTLDQTRLCGGVLLGGEHPLRVQLVNAGELFRNRSQTRCQPVRVSALS